MCRRAANLWDVKLDAVDYRDGVFSGPGEDQRKTFPELASEAVNAGGPVSAVGSVNVREWGGHHGH